MNSKWIPSGKRPMNCAAVGLLPALLLLAIGRSAPAALIAPLGDPQKIDVPQAGKGTFAVGISGDMIVGGYYSSAAVNHGFIANRTLLPTDPSLPSDSAYKKFDVPGSLATTISGISGNRSVGSYTDGDGTHGFVYESSMPISVSNPTNPTPLNYPTAPTYTVANGISGNNIVGFFQNDGIHGFLYDGTNWTPIDDPTAGTQFTVAYGISGSDIVGYFMESDHLHGFSYRGGAYTTLDFPGSISTAAYGISGDNIVGAYQDWEGGYHGFLFDGANWKTLNVASPDALSTKAYGISGNQVVGEYIDTSFVNHGFIATIPEPSSIALLALGGLICGAAIRRRRQSGQRQRFA
jgi:hypothetical protein